ncbi:MAG: hypothetical protein MK108_07715 [Mariniblastus sp.]|nr:hypothetical protein [Mariniblastus sp.]
MDSSSQSNDFVVGNCIGCNGLVRVPSHTRAQVKVRCPRCGETYQLSEILDHDIPALEVVEDSAGLNDAVESPDESKYEPVTEQQDGRFIVPAYLAKAAERKPRRRSRSSSRESERRVRDQAAGSTGEKSGDQRVRPERVRQGRNSRKRNPALDFIMYLLGGLMALPVAQLMIWWILGSDPIGIAPEVSKVVPMVVPPDLREGDSVETGAEGKMKRGQRR